jgi:hypothetical protein
MVFRCLNEVTFPLTYKSVVFSVKPFVCGVADVQEHHSVEDLDIKQERNYQGKL